MRKMVGAGTEIFDKLEPEPKFLTSWSRSRTKMDRLRNTGTYSTNYWRCVSLLSSTCRHRSPIPVEFMSSVQVWCDDPYGSNTLVWHNLLPFTWNLDLNEQSRLNKVWQQQMPSPFI
jgi:hypothetical protein